jgi:hypothetical protein
MTEQSLMARELGLDPSAQPVEMLLNPLKATVGQIGGTVETARSGPPRYDMHIQMRSRGEEKRVYSLSAFRHQDRRQDAGPSSGSCHYNVRLQAHDGPVTAGGETFCGKLNCSADGTRYTFCDDPSNFYSWPRELGAVVVSGENLVALLPRVHPSGAAAQFRVLREDDGIIARFFAGQARQHLSLLSGPWATKRSGGEVQLVLLNTDTSQRDDVVFRARESQGTLTISFRHPLSAYQAFCIALALVHHAQVQAQQMQMQQPQGAGEGAVPAATSYSHGMHRV